MSKYYIVCDCPKHKGKVIKSADTEKDAVEKAKTDLCAVEANGIKYCQYIHNEKDECVGDTSRGFF